MTSYLLLRNNKQTGPFTVNELVSQGLKAYDLVWANGKSAAWRYPGEIEELKPYAPAVEEQPYDRFYKKSTEKKEEPIQQVNPVSQKAQVTEYIPVAETPVFIEPVAEIPDPVPQPKIEPIEEPAFVKPETVREAAPAYAAKKSVYVTMPGQRMPQDAPIQKQSPAVAAAPPVTTSIPVSAPKSEYERYQPASAVSQNYTREAQQEKTISITENPVAAEIKYSQPLDEIKEMYVKTLHERKQRIANKAIILQTVKKAAILIAIVGAGVLIGFTIKSNSGKQVIASASETISKEPEAIPESQQEQPGSEVLQNEENTVAENNNTTASTPPLTMNENHPSLTMNENQWKITTENKSRVKGTMKSEEPVEEEQAITPPKEIVEAEKEEIVYDKPETGVEMNQNTGERSRKTRTNVPAEVENPSYENQQSNEGRKDARKSSPPVSNRSLASQVSVKTNAYKIVAFGGIRDLQLTVYNDSKYVLDKVMVELQYLKPSEEPFRIDILQFKSVSPNGSLTIRMPDTNRGIKVRYRILNILSTQSAKDLADL